MNRDDLFMLLERLEQPGDFTHTSLTERKLRSFERILHHRLPETYRLFLKKFGQGGIDNAFVILGMNALGEPTFLKATQDYRWYSLPVQLILIEEGEYGYYCLHHRTGQIYRWIPGKEATLLYSDFESYLEEKLRILGRISENQ